MQSPSSFIGDPAALIPRLHQALLDGPLPGPQAQMQMAPALRQAAPLPADRPRPSAVLALLHASSQGAALIFTLRPKTLSHHAGQISFPGGGVEASDATYAATALRETQEELGIPLNGVRLLGAITPLFIAPSQNLVHPYVGWQPDLPPLKPNPAEVAAVLDVPLQTLLNPSTQAMYAWQRDGQSLTAPCYRVGKADIWGATAMILSELLTIIRGLEA